MVSGSSWTKSPRYRQRRESCSNILCIVIFSSHLVDSSISSFLLFCCYLIQNFFLLPLAAPTQQAYIEGKVKKQTKNPHRWDKLPFGVSVLVHTAVSFWAYCPPLCSLPIQGDIQTTLSQVFIFKKGKMFP